MQYLSCEIRNILSWENIEVRKHHLNKEQISLFFANRTLVTNYCTKFIHNDVLYRQAVAPGGAGTVASPYLQQLYAANPYIHPNILNLAGLTGQGN